MRQGKLYFVDHHQQRIFGWSASEGLTIERDNPLDPVNLAFDKAGDLLVLSSEGAEGTVYSFRPGSPADQITVLAPQAMHRRIQARWRCCRSNYWNNGEFEDQLDFNTMTLHDAGRDVRPRRVHSEGDENTSRPTAAASCPRGGFSSRALRTASGWRFSDNLDAMWIHRSEHSASEFMSAVRRRTAPIARSSALMAR